MNTKDIKDIKDIEEVSKETASCQSRRGLLINSLIRFFDIPSNLNQFLHVINGESDISLRLLDWLITNYAKSHNVVYMVTVGGVEKQLNIYLNYKTQLKAYSKKQFDPFQRRERIAFQVDMENNEKKRIITKDTTTVNISVNALNDSPMLIDLKIVKHDQRKKT